MGESLSVFIILAFAVEIITEGIKNIFPTLKPNMSQATAAAVGITLSILTQTGILSQMGLGLANPYIDFVVTGLLISKGSNALHDFTTILHRNAG